MARTETNESFAVAGKIVQNTQLSLDPPPGLAMTYLLTLWLPILVSAVLVFVLSSVIHMLSPWHKTDYPRLVNEEAAMDALRPLAIPEGEYMVPRPASREDMRSPEFTARINRGPVFILTMMPNGMMSMGRNLGLWFVYLIVVATFAGYIAQSAVLSGDNDHRVFHTVGLAALMGYSMALWQMSIWYRRPWLTTIKSTVDGLIYAVVTAAVFVWLWPK